MSFLLVKAPTTITLRSPDWGNSYSLNDNDIRRYTRSGVLRVFDDANWAVILVYKYSFSRIQKSVITALKAFLELNAGLSVTFTDHLGVVRVGYIQTPVQEIVAVRPDCSYDVSFEMMVVQ